MIQYKHLRAVIFAVVFALLYLLFLRWNDFTERHGTQAGETQQVAQNAPAAGSAVPLNPASTSVPEDINTTPIPNETTVKKGLVEVQTDVLRFTIDLQGGDLVASELLHYDKSIKNRTPLTLLQYEQKQYLINSGFIGQDGLDSTGKRAQYTTAATSYQLADGEQTLRVVLTHTSDDVEVQKILVFMRNSYDVQQDFVVRNTSYTAKNMAIYSHIKRGLFGDEYDTLKGFGVSSYLGAALSTPDDSYQKITFDDIQEQNLNVRAVTGWVAMLQHYFVTALIPPQDQVVHFYTRYSNTHALLGYRTDVFSVPPAASYTVRTHIYSGPKIKNRLEHAQKNLPLTIDYGWFWFISELLMWLLLKLQTIFGNWGMSIIMLTVVVRLVFFWPTKKAFYSMARMRLAMPQIEAIKSRVGDDKQALSREVMAFYKKEKLNPIGGCLPMLLQMPVFIALYWGLLESVELRHAGFILWINDLSTPDPYFVLPILMGITFFLQQHLNPQAATMDPMMKQVMRWMPVVFTVLFLWLPSGLVLYFVTSNSWSIIQQYVITKQLEAQQKHG